MGSEDVKLLEKGKELMYISPRSNRPAENSSGLMNSLVMGNSSKVVGCFLTFVMLGLLCLPPQQIAEARQVMKEGKFTIDINDDFQCGEEAELTITVPDRRFFKGDPRHIRVLIGNVRGPLSEECGQYAFRSVKIIGKEGDVQVFSGSAQKSESWKIVSDNADDQGEQHDGQEPDVRIKFRLPNSSAGIDYAGTCQRNPIIPLKPVYYNNADAALSKPATMRDYRVVAPLIAEQYLSACPGTETIDFSLNPIPEGYVCVSGFLCYLNWSAQNPKEVMTAEFKRKPRLKDYDDVIQAFAEGNFDILREYKEFNHLFHNDFAERYTDICRDHVDSTVTFEIESIQTRYNSDGFVESKNKVGPTVHIHIDENFAKRYKAFYGPNKAWGALLLMNRVVDQRSRRPGSAGMIKGVSYFIDNLNQIDQFLSKGCTTEKVRTVYDNIDRFYRHQPPVKAEKEGEKRKGTVPAKGQGNL